MPQSTLTQKERLARIEMGMQSIHKQLEELPALREDLRHILAYQNRQKGAIAVMLAVGSSCIALGTIFITALLKKVFLH